MARGVTYLSINCNLVQSAMNYVYIESYKFIMNAIIIINK